MIIDFSSNPPLPELQKHAPHLQNYRRVYQASEQQVDDFRRSGGLCRII